MADKILHEIILIPTNDFYNLRIFGVIVFVSGKYGVTHLATIVPENAW